MNIFVLLLVLVLILIISYWLLIKPYSYWEKQNVQILPNSFPGFGHMLPIITLKENMSTMSMKVYKNCDTSAIGFYFLRKPGLIVRDPELVKSVLQNNFNSFHNNAINVNEKADPILSKNPFFATDLETWKTARARTTSHLTGKKLRHLSVIFQEVCSKMNTYISRKIQENDADYFECELKNHFVKYTGEIVANSAFAIEGQSFEDNPDPLSFSKVAGSLFMPSLINGIKQALLFFIPSVGNFLELSLLEKKTDNYFRENMKAILKRRKETNSSPNDYLQFCIDSNGENNIDSIIADVIIFYGDVYETSSTTLATLFYHLSQHPDIQEKLRDHIESTVQANGGVITYELLMNMTYLEQAILESMRLLAPLGAQMKLCTKEVTLTGSDGLKYHLKPGHPVVIPVWALHNDNAYWPNPEIFDPNRFSPENSAYRNKYVYLAFGEGPRMCIGMRLGMLLVKFAAATILTKYSVENSEKTKKPLEFDTSTLMLYVKGGLWAKFKKLN